MKLILKINDGGLKGSRRFWEGVSRTPIPGRARSKIAPGFMHYSRYKNCQEQRKKVAMGIP